MVSRVVSLLAFTAACLVSTSYAQAQGAAINCYQCTNTGAGNSGCGSTFVAGTLTSVACKGQCTKTIEFDATGSNSGGANGGPMDVVYRGCTETTPAVGCYKSEASPGITTCVSVCSTNLCNSAVSMTQSLVVRLIAAVGLLVVVLNFLRM